MRALIVSLLLLFGACCGVAGAQTVSCSFTVPGGIVFPEMSAFSQSAVDTTGKLHVSCSQKGPVYLGPLSVAICPYLGAGSGGATASDRGMANGTSRLSYELFTDQARTQIWGSGGNASVGVPPLLILSVPTSGSATADATIYGRVAGNQNLPVGNYTSSFGAADTPFVYGTISVNVGGCALTLALGYSGSASFSVNETLAGGCSVGSSDLGFPNTTDLTRDDIAAQAAISVKCTATTPYSVALGMGSGGGTDPAQRRMKRTGGTETIAYGLYKDAAHHVPWGSTTGSDTLDGQTGSGLNQSIPVYGLVKKAPATPPPGSYSDDVAISINY
ncbi:Spore coat protein U (SCPU) domain-containing protein [Faunimonas pinastri]|uniref:Spore coat protein U (SCPU) domain-containing protein n=1 Tax=Faunimonas pinastri TaxID=1855383 RepID=A0A1H9B537_9HYPH|nr:spore coat U domain-containing protein [Faunimonas pinastri]SEP84136.1 Spore coat protein U (SCPU) domain-containing protein [Faunimonas pinastri]